MLIDIGAEEPADDRNVAQDRGAILRLLHVFPHQTTKHHRLAVPNAHARGNFARAEDRLIDDVRREHDARLSRIVTEKRSTETDWIGLP